MLKPWVVVTARAAVPVTFIPPDAIVKLLAKYPVPKLDNAKELQIAPVLLKPWVVVANKADVPVVCDIVPTVVVPVTFIPPAETVRPPVATVRF